MRQCQGQLCRKEVIPARDGRYCSRCRNKRYRKNSPFKYHYKNLKNRAKERDKEFSLTLEQFKEIWKRHPEKWKEKLADTECNWQMDRIRNHEGYHYNNIQILSKHKNIRKYFDQDRKFCMDAKWVPETNSIDEEVPF